ncbi:glycosyltransferase [Aliarcobacter thereius]|uniref:glycosyltransferase n=1 Tax=Aliarcobacter thereius TaxID=544718 RepID=UPI0008267347|nr:glycosyltransferase [Aliarcobacter thereius]OCL91228.1 N-acetylglucosaminyl-diphospho-decaprenol L-rhamnosyltransferase [Aliarcobacter thereius]
MKLHATIVLFEDNDESLKKAIFSFLNTSLDVKLYLVDNSSTTRLQYLQKLDYRIEYIYTGENLGFGKAHNIALQKSIDNKIDYHLVLNPDIYFNSGVLEELLVYMEKNRDVANIMPKVFYPNGEIQYLCKLLPTPKELIVRRFVASDKTIQKINYNYELRSFGYDKILNVPFLSGCFMLLRVECLKDIGLFDEKIFMYMEDIDLNRRLHAKYKTIFYPYVNITHIHAQESYKRKWLLFKHIQSTIYYFNKWGWFFDDFRKEINKKTLNNIKKL